VNNPYLPKILYVSPHLSTGGLPQYLLKKIEVFNKLTDIYCVEYNFYGEDYVVQRNKIKSILGNKFLSLNDAKEKILDFIEDVNPNVIHFEEIPETFISGEILQKIYHPDRKYYICETCHSSTIDPHIKKYKPDKFVMVNEWIQDKFGVLNVPSEILEYPIENKDVKKSESMSLLGLNPEKKHILNVGLFTPGKNQGEVIKYAKALEKFPIEFHFVGNQASNFSDYWRPLMKILPTNCKIWGERDDVNLFLQSADLFLFPSKFELNPLVIKEALSYRIPSMFYNLATYNQAYNSNHLVTFLTSNFELNAYRILELLEFVKKIDPLNDNS
jgi:glycosyltransferase involved in cell wall biosynthesis